MTRPWCATIERTALYSRWIYFHVKSLEKFTKYQSFSIAAPDRRVDVVRSAIPTIGHVIQISTRKPSPPFRTPPRPPSNNKTKKRPCPPVKSGESPLVVRTNSIRLNPPPSPKQMVDSYCASPNMLRWHGEPSRYTPRLCPSPQKTNSSFDPTLSRVLVAVPYLHGLELMPCPRHTLPLEGVLRGYSSRVHSPPDQPV